MNGSWGSEERKIAYNPFGAGQFFDVSLGVLFAVPTTEKVWLDLIFSLPYSCQSGAAQIDSRCLPTASTFLTSHIDSKHSKG